MFYVKYSIKDLRNFLDFSDISTNIGCKFYQLSI